MRVTSLLQKVPAQGTQTREGSPLGKGTTVQYPAQAENQEHLLPACLSASQLCPWASTSSRPGISPHPAPRPSPPP